ncbi:MAG TPA: hypothetical protein VNA24_35270, partial [Hyalangium sp.]|nr:hypothetical protein [Hyalangium sp.]
MTEPSDKTQEDSGLDALKAALWARPSGLGTSAARLAELLARVRAGDLDPPLPPAGSNPAYAERSWGDGTFSKLYCPIT